MEVHCEVDDPRLQIIRHLVDHDLRADVDKFDIGQIRLRKGLIHLLVVPNPVPKVSRRLLRVLPDVIWRSGLYFQDITHDQILVITLALDKEDVVALRVTTLLDPLPSVLGRISSIKDPDMPAFVLKPAKHVGDGSLGSGATETFALGVTGVEKRGRGMGGVRTTVGSNIEGFGIDREPSQVTDDCGYVQD